MLIKLNISTFYDSEFWGEPLICQLIDNAFTTKENIEILANRLSQKNGQLSLSEMISEVCHLNVKDNVKMEIKHQNYEGMIVEIENFILKMVPVTNEFPEYHCDKLIRIFQHNKYSRDKTSNNESHQHEWNMTKLLNYFKNLKVLGNFKVMFIHEIVSGRNSKTKQINYNSNNNNAPGIKSEENIKLKEQCQEVKKKLSLEEEKKLILNQMRIKEEQRKAFKLQYEEQLKKEEATRLEERQKLKEMKYESRIKQPKPPDVPPLSVDFKPITEIKDDSKTSNPVIKSNENTKPKVKTRKPQKAPVPKEQKFKFLSKNKKVNETKLNNISSKKPGDRNSPQKRTNSKSPKPKKVTKSPIRKETKSKKNKFQKYKSPQKSKQPKSKSPKRKITDSQKRDSDTKDVETKCLEPDEDDHHKKPSFVEKKSLQLKNKGGCCATDVKQSKSSIVEKESKNAASGEGETKIENVDEAGALNKQ